MPGSEVIKLFLWSTQLGMKFILLINVKMPTIVGILTFISIINTVSVKSFKKKSRNFPPFYLLRAIEISGCVELSMKKSFIPQSKIM